RSKSSRGSSASGRVSRRKRSRKGRPRRSRRGLNPFMKFAKKERGKIKRQRPNLSVTQVAKELGKRWRKLSPQQKKKYGAKDVGEGKKRRGGRSKKGKSKKSKKKSRRSQ
ncbi:High mobility group protein DSP1-like protein, partial [Leptotrombidium deliense]